ncbi:MAG: esterase family protein [Gemmatimonadetes bacterium]|nr:esterase family protein [Gemmatimonadota bacterium]
MHPAVGALLGACIAAAVSHAGLPRADAQAPRGRSANVGSVRTDTLWSQALGARKSLVVYLPPSYTTESGRRYPVAYYLHGADGDETNWTGVGRIAAVMDSLIAAGAPEMILAMPDGDNSWYTTFNVLVDAARCRQLLPTGADAERDCVAWPHYDDYVAFDVVRFVDARYRTVVSAAGRGIAGLSMGGYGAFQLAAQYPGVFGAAASHSGVLWPRELAPPTVGPGLLRRAAADSGVAARFRNQWAERTRLIFGADSAAWLARDPATTLKRLKASGGRLPALYADCGASDVFVAQNRAFRDALRVTGIPLEYHEWPGGHSWPYWRAHGGESLAWLGRQLRTR